MAKVLIKKSEIDQGEPEERAEEIAARTANKYRRQEGHTPNRTTQGTGNPQYSLETHTHDELYNQTKQLE